MAKLNLTLPVGEVAVTGKQITFVAPCDSEGLTHIILDNNEYELVDSKGDTLTERAFIKEAMVSIILHTDTYKAYIQNPNTNAYLEAMFAGDQKPVYATATELAGLTTGEKLSVAFGKIARAVLDLISHLANKANPHGVTKKQVGLEFADNTSDMDKPVSTAQAEAIATVATNASNALSTHNTNTESHSDLRLALQELSNWVKDLLDSDDETLNEMHEIVAYIKSNKALIDAITTSKVNVADIVNDLVTNVSNKPLSAAQGVAIKALIDALQTAVNGKAAEKHGHAISDVTNLQTSLDSKANKADIASTVYAGTTGGSDTYFKISNFGNWGTGAWYEKGFSMLISSRAGEMVWVSVAANDSNTSAGAFRLINRYDKIKAVYFNTADSSIYVTMAAWSNNICAHLLTNLNGDYVPTVESVTEVPSDAVAIPIVEFGVTSDSAVVGDSSVLLKFGGSGDRPSYNGANMAMQSDIPTKSKTLVFTYEDDSTETVEVLTK